MSRTYAIGDPVWLTEQSCRVAGKVVDIITTRLHGTEIVRYRVRWVNIADPQATTDHHAVGLSPRDPEASADDTTHNVRGSYL